MRNLVTVLSITSLALVGCALGLFKTLQANANSSIAYETQQLPPDTGHDEPSQDRPINSWTANSNESNAVDGGAFEHDGARTEQIPSKESAYPESTDIAASTVAPVRVRISTIGLNSPIVPVGINSKGEMDVPSGTTNNVGWYKYGTVPGNEGTAVLDAHVFAAFKNLHKARVGDIIEVVQSDNTTLRFKIDETHVYPLAEVPAERLFTSTHGQHLNLITCAGTFIPHQATYSHRLIVYATRIE